MLWLWLFARAPGAEPVEVEAGRLGARGERVGVAEIVRVEAHPEFERYWLRAPDGELVAELAREDGVHHGLCAAGGQTLYPRPELVPGAVGRIALEPLCERLAAAPAAVLPVAMPVGPPVALAVPAALGPAGWLRPALAALALATGLAALVAARGRGALLLGTALGAAAVRVLLGTPALFDGGTAGVEKLRVALGWVRTESWGPGYATWMRPAVLALGERPEAVFAANLVWASAWPALVAWAADRLAGRRVAWAAGAAAALLPAHVGISWSEAMHVSAVTWAMLALVGALELRAGGHLGALLLAGGGVAAVATRPDLAVLLAVAPVWLGVPPPGRRLAAAAAGALVAAAAIAAASGGAGALLHGVDARALVGLLRPRWGEPGAEAGFFVSWHAGFTPWVWWGLAAAGLVGGRWRGGPAPLRVPALVLCGLGALPFVLKVDPLPDAVRLQLFAQAGLVLLVAGGAARLGRLGALLLVGGALAGPAPAGSRWLHRQEWSFLAEELPKLPADAVVARAAGDRGEAFREIMEALGPARWTAADGATLLYRAPGDPPIGGAPRVERPLEGVDVDAPEPELHGRWRQTAAGVYAPDGGPR